MATTDYTEIVLILVIAIFAATAFLVLLWAIMNHLRPRLHNHQPRPQSPDIEALAGHELARRAPGPASPPPTPGIEAPTPAGSAAWSLFSGYAGDDEGRGARARSPPPPSYRSREAVRAAKVVDDAVVRWIEGVRWPLLSLGRSLTAGRGARVAGPGDQTPGGRGSFVIGSAGSSSSEPVLTPSSASGQPSEPVPSVTPGERLVLGLDVVAVVGSGSGSGGAARRLTWSGGLRQRLGNYRREDRTRKSV